MRLNSAASCKMALAMPRLSFSVGTLKTELQNKDADISSGASYFLLLLKGRQYARIQIAPVRI